MFEKVQIELIKFSSVSAIANEGSGSGGGSGFRPGQPSNPGVS